MDFELQKKEQEYKSNMSSPVQAGNQIISDNSEEVCNQNK